jgi:hypothetical protein
LLGGDRVTVAVAASRRNARPPVADCESDSGRNRPRANDRLRELPDFAGWRSSRGCGIKAKCQAASRRLRSKFRTHWIEWILMRDPQSAPRLFGCEKLILKCECDAKAFYSEGLLIFGESAASRNGSEICNWTFVSLLETGQMQICPVRSIISFWKRALNFRWNRCRLCGRNGLLR